MTSEPEDNQALTKLHQILGIHDAVDLQTTISAFMELIPAHPSTETIAGMIAFLREFLPESFLDEHLLLAFNHYFSEESGESLNAKTYLEEMEELDLSQKGPYIGLLAKEALVSASIAVDFTSDQGLSTNAMVLRNNIPLQPATIEKEIADLEDDFIYEEHGTPSPHATTLIFGDADLKSPEASIPNKLHFIAVTLPTGEKRYIFYQKIGSDPVVVYDNPSNTAFIDLLFQADPEFVKENKEALGVLGIAYHRVYLS